MASEVTVRVKESNAETLNFTLTSNVVGYTLAGKSIRFIVKRYRSDHDVDACFDYTDGPEITVTDAALLKLKVEIPVADLPWGGTYFYRLDVIDAGKPNTAMYGLFIVEDL